MPHIHDLIDFTVAAYIVYENKVLLVDHIKLKTWMPIGGHIELNEDPEEALIREVKEECGLDIEVLGSKPDLREEGIKPLIPPIYMDIHDIDDSHKHVGLVYFAISGTDKVTLAEKEHNQFRWFSKEEINDPAFGVRPFISFYSEKALDQIKT